MIYGGVIHTLPNTLASAPMETVVDITSGLIYHVKIIFPPGPSGLLHVQVFDISYQLFPTTIGASFVGDNLKMEWDEMYDKDEAPHILIVKTWNDDDTYAHDVSVLFSIVSKEEYKARYLPMMAQNVLVQSLAESEASTVLARRERVKAFMEKISAEEE